MQQVLSEMNTGRAKTWSIYSSSNNNTSHAYTKEGPWKSYGSPMNAIYFGFVATAILISMFLIMAIFEHLFSPGLSDDESSGYELRQMQKLGSPEIVQTSYASDFSVVMPGQQYPTFIAQPAPLPCQREGVYRPPYHEHSLV